MGPPEYLINKITKLEFKYADLYNYFTSHAAVTTLIVFRKSVCDCCLYRTRG